MMKALIALLACVIVGGPQLLAFAGHEHAAVSNNGLRLALIALENGYGRTTPCGLTTSEREIVNYFLREQSLVTYGDLVNSVDYLVNPLKGLQRDDGAGQFPRLPEQLDEYTIERIMTQSLAKLRAKTVNDTHFQAELTTGIRFWHLAAVQIAAHGEASAVGDAVNKDATDRQGARSGNLLTALMLNAIADHYLQDFFAPGHIFTDRYGMHDAAAGALHNTYNILGAKFHVTQWDDLRDLLALMPADMRQALEIDGSFGSVLKQGLTPVELWGDSNLHRNPLQRLLLVLLVARSTLDVLESFCNGTTEKHNNFADGVAFHPMKMGTDRGIRNLFCAGGATFIPPRGELPYGTYEFPNAYSRCVYSANIFQPSLGAETVRISGNAVTRAVADFDIVLLADRALAIDRRTRNVRPRQRQGAITAGITYGTDGEQTAQGFRVRAMRASPFIHVQYGVEAGLRRYRHESGSERAAGWAAVFQTGFSLLTLDLRVGNDHAFNQRGELEKALSVRTGISVAGPLLGVPGVGRIEQWFWERVRRRAMRE